ncbi:hypothetical protein O181_026667 [Austropuccinia psidii MF-1]|uniref:Mitochondrial distribution and morphology protein 10 n=1 Tax=Austropuccinia psidii MF-1 TaxID=1389203 RepID=A0A9Q3CNH7_9BASI|nr:hypothetical protein [Austropuccinia psidii MF-1]
MHPFGSQLLRAHYAATGWDPDNDYAQLTQPTRALLDLTFVPGLHFSLGKSPISQFANSASLSVLSPPLIVSGSLPSTHSCPSPTLTGSLSYLFSSSPSFQVTPTRSVALTTVIDRFVIPPPPSTRKHSDLDNNGSHKDYLLYGRFHLPTYRLDALFTKRLSPTIQALATLVSVPLSPPILTIGNIQNQDLSPASHLSSNNPSPSIWNLMLAISHNTGEWSQHYCYSCEDGLFGARVLHNFPNTTTTKRRGNGFNHNTSGTDHQFVNHVNREKLVDEEEVMDNVLKGRFSVGGELYFSTRKKSAGVSTGIRFCTIPDPPGSALTQQPTVISATLNPIMGQMSTSYGTKIGPNVAVVTQFDFNLFSFDSDITFAGEWLQWRPVQIGSKIGMGGDLKLDASAKPIPRNKDTQGLIHSFWRAVGGQDNLVSVLRARVSPMTGLTMMWEGRWQECLVGLGLTSEFLVSNHGCNSQKEGFQPPVIKARMSNSNTYHNQQDLQSQEKEETDLWGKKIP